MLAQVPDQADHVLRHQAADGAAGVHAHDHLALGVQHEAGGLQVQRVFIDERAGQPGDRAGVRAVPQRESEAVLGGELRGGLLVAARTNDLSDDFVSGPPATGPGRLR
jgi:hypothetical protein